MDQTMSVRLRNEFQSQQLLPALMMETATCIIYALSIASLIFNGDAASFHEFIARLFSERLAFITRTLETALK